MTQVSKSSFDEAKAAEVAFFFLSKAKEFGMHITKLRFIKWMYLTERLSYKKFGEPLLGDRLFAMRHGPVLSNTLFLIENPIKANKTKGLWESVVSIESQSKNQYITIAEKCHYKTSDDLRALSDAEIELLEQVWQAYGRMNARKLETTLHDHQSFPEWKWKEGDGSNPIELESLLPILGYTQNQTDALIKHIQSHEYLDQAFAH